MTDQPVKSTSLRALQERQAGHAAHNRMVIKKLIFFSLLLFLAPVGTFFILRHILEAAGNPNAIAWSGIAAIIMVNVVIVLYILSAMREDEAKEIVPPVGRFAKRKEQGKND